jgi:hypothetical protein
VAAVATVGLVAVACESSELPPMACAKPADAEALAARPSPFDSAMTTVAGTDLKLCYSRPSTRGRLVFGGLVPYDTLWRTGANEPTIFHLSGPATIAGLQVEEGDYSIYTVPSPDQWTVVVNASTSQWGLTRDEVGAQGNQFINAYTDEVRAQEVGRAPIETTAIDFTERLTASFGFVDGADVDLYFDWAATRIVIPVRVGVGDR